MIDEARTYLDFSLIQEKFTILDDLDGNCYLIHQVVGFSYLTEWTFTD